MKVAGVVGIYKFSCPLVRMFTATKSFERFRQPKSVQDKKAEEKRVEGNFSIFEYVKFSDYEVNVFVTFIAFLQVVLNYAIDHTFHGFTGVINHAGCWENTKKACKSRAEGE